VLFLELPPLDSEREDVREELVVAACRVVGACLGLFDSLLIDALSLDDAVLNCGELL
jgi:hypothetical protein